jgi:hypothetical protein
MGSSSKHASDSGGAKRHMSAESPSYTKHRQLQNEDWADVTDPEERRRIQNRIAQRKFREKTRENKERAERDARNRDNAGNTYRVTSPDKVMDNGEDDLSGLPWGSVNLKHVIYRGHDDESRKSSGNGGAYIRDDESQYMSPYADTIATSGSGSYHHHHHHHHHRQQPSANYIVGGGDDMATYYDEDLSLVYGTDTDPARQSYYPCAQWRGNSFPMNPSLLQQYDFGDGSF